MKVIVAHPTSNQVNRAMIKGLNKARLLKRFYTTVACFPNDTLYKLGHFRPFSEIKRRSFDVALKDITKSNPFKEFMRMTLPKIGLQQLTEKDIAPYSVWSVYKNFDKKIASELPKEIRNGAVAVYAYEDGAYQTFKKASELGLKCFYDQPIGYWRAAKKMFEEEREKWPEWAVTMPGENWLDEKLTNKDNELKLADCVFAASSFTASTLKEYPHKIKDLRVIPFGFPETKADKVFEKITNNRKLKLLFVGGLSQRKGIANLFAAVNEFKDQVTLTVVGKRISNDCRPLNEELAKHNYIESLPFQEVLNLMGEHDIFVFPSLFEGFGLVITEAMSQGLPVITTINTAGGDLIEHGENGWLVEPGNTEALIALLADLIKTPEQIVDVAKAALQTAKKRPWSVYSQEVVQVINELI